MPWICQQPDFILDPMVCPCHQALIHRNMSSSAFPHPTCLRQAGWKEYLASLLLISSLLRVQHLEEQLPLQLSSLA